MPKQLKHNYLINSDHEVYTVTPQPKTYDKDEYMKWILKAIKNNQMEDCRV